MGKRTLASSGLPEDGVDYFYSNTEIFGVSDVERLYREACNPEREAAVLELIELTANANRENFRLKRQVERANIELFLSVAALWVVIFVQIAQLLGG